MSNITGLYNTARGAVWGARHLVDDAWAHAVKESSAAIDADGKSAVVRKFSAIFAAFAQLNYDDNVILGAPGHNHSLESKRAILDRHPALAAHNVELEAHAIQMEAHVALNTANMAARIKADLPSLLLGKIRASGGDLSLAKGALLASVGAVLDHGWGTAIYSERKAEFVAILKAEADAASVEAAKLAPVVIA